MMIFYPVVEIFLATGFILTFLKNKKMALKIFNAFWKLIYVVSV